MSTNGPTLLCAGDLHLGRFPTRIPEEYDTASCSPKSVWQRVVQTALDEEVTAVVLSGDIIDRENRYYEAYGAFEEGAMRLNDAEIPTLVVTGNHDADSLPPLVDDLGLEHVTLLGRNGSWERHTIVEDGAPVVHIDGWSFPQSQVLYSPVRDYDLAPANEPVVGLLHADFETGDSDYAPVQRSDLEATHPETWVLGHIHAPGVRVDADPCVFYPGSPQPLDPGEPGGHGPWLLRCRGSGSNDLQHLPRASIRYETVEVDVSDIETAKAAPSRIQRATEQTLGGVDTGELSLIVARIRLTGRTECHGALLQDRDALEAQLQFEVRGTPVTIERLRVATEPSVDLETLADGEGPVAHLARLVQTLGDGVDTDEFNEVRSDAREAMQEVHGHGTYRPLRTDGRLAPPDADQADEVLRDQARLLLHELQSQEGNSS